jgi:hypothetical protein
LITWEDLRDEQDYLNEKRKRLNEKIRALQILDNIQEFSNSDGSLITGFFLEPTPAQIRPWLQS